MIKHFDENEVNMQLDPEEQLKYIPYPVFTWWKVDQRPIVTRYLRGLATPIDYFSALFTDAILDHICLATGDVVHDGITESLTVNQLKRYFGQELMRGYVGLRDVKLLWTEAPISIDYPNKENRLWKNHWFAISANIAFDSEYVHDALVERFKLHLVPGYNVTIDEIRIPCAHELCPYKNHNRAKPDVWAIESKSLHAENGYLLDSFTPVKTIHLPRPRRSFNLLSG